MSVAALMRVWAGGQLLSGTCLADRLLGKSTQQGEAELRMRVTMNMTICGSNLVLRERIVVARTAIRPR